MTVAVIDGHNDALTAEWHDQLTRRRDTGHIDLPRMREAGVRAAFFAVWVAPETWPPEGGVDAFPPQPDADGGVRFDVAPAVDAGRATAVATRTAGRLLALARSGEVTLVRSIADLDALRDGDGPPGAILHIEGAEAIDPGLEALELWHAAGLRSLGPVWSRPTAFGHGVPITGRTSPDSGPGLTDAGRMLVRRCAELGIMVDLAHLNAAGFWDVAGLEAGPLVSSHAGVHALCETSRNLTDDQLDAVAATGGLIGIVYGTRFLRPDFATDGDTPLELIARHAAYVAERVGVAHVALGSDFDGTTVPDAVGDVTGVPRVLQALRDVGFSEPEIRAIAWENWRRVLSHWWRAG